MFKNKDKKIPVLLILFVDYKYKITTIKMKTLYLLLFLL